MISQVQAPNPMPSFRKRTGMPRYGRRALPDCMNAGERSGSGNPKRILFAEQAEHVFLVGFHAGLVERVDVHGVTAQGASVFEKIEKLS